ncbi:MAG: hypothetical protein N3D77_01130 [Geminicoccaceae bacterium]|nr:hypothetical protein [Geminicoccaceae bacterium]
MGSSAAARGQRHGTDPLARGLRLVAFAAALSVVASILDGRLRGRPAEPGVLLPIPEAVEPRPTAPSTTASEMSAPPPEPPSAPEPTTQPEKPALALPAEPVVQAPVPPVPLAPSPEPAPPVELPRAPSGTVRDGVLAYQAGDFARAFAIWRPLAEAGNARAQFHLGALYLEGRIGPPDYALAYRWLALAARAGQAAAAPLRDQAAARLPAETLAAIRRELGPDP